MVRRIMFAGGGTGGHLFPAFALAEEFERRLDKDCEIRFFAGGRELEMKLIGDRGYKTARIRARGLKRGSVTGNLLFPFVLIYGIMQSMLHILRFDPELVFGTGGYLSFPAVLAAKLTNRSAFLLEPNSYAGVATCKAARFADLIFITYEQSVKQIKFVEKCILLGTPVSARLGQVSLSDALSKFSLQPGKQTVLIVGGSQGAASINEKIASSLAQFASYPQIQLIWQVGQQERYLQSFNSSGVAGSALKFVDDMPAAYQAADLVICRAGALTLAELTALGKPSILIPFPHATEDHQTKNAQTLVDAGAALMIRDSELSNIDPVKVVIGLLADESRLMQMGLAAASLGRRNAAEAIVQRVFEFMGWR